MCMICLKAKVVLKADGLEVSDSLSHIRQVVSSSDRMLQDHKILFPQNRVLQAQACIGVCAKLTCVKSQMTSSDVPHL